LASAPRLSRPDPRAFRSARSWNRWSHNEKKWKATRLWSAIEESISELGATGEISINTDSDYVVGYLCRELVAQKLIGSEESRP
jgi:hypothetical protein